MMTSINESVRRVRWIAAACAFLVVTIAVSAGEAPKFTPQQVEFFESRVRPVLAENCWSCHGSKKQSGGIRLDSRKSILEESEHGPVVVPGAPEKSALIKAIRHTGEIRMPPKQKLPPQAVEALTTWIKTGAAWPDAKSATGSDDAWKKHWAFQPIRNPPLPTVKNTAWPRTSIDHFMLAELEKKSLRPSPPADPHVLLRRLFFDLIGLPPTPEEMEDFVAAWDDGRAKRQATVAGVVDRLLASPHYGERWGRHWLDVARYADTKGYVFFEDADFTWAWTYRDYVIDAFNRDLSYDRFIVEQLAADQLPLEQDKRPLRALGFLSLGGRFMNNIHDILDDRIDVVTRGLTGLTVTCARCHDHKYDPLTQKDYYGLYGVFASCTEPTVPPLYEPPPNTQIYYKFNIELQTLEKKLTDFVRAKHEELTTNARKRVGEYLMAAHALRDQPSTEEFMLIADGADLNPTMTVRWQKYLDQRAKSPDPVFGPWHALASLPDKDFANAAAPMLKQVLADPQQPANPLIAKVLAGLAPKNLTEVAKAYAAALASVDRQWQQASKLGKTQLDEPAAEELRLVFYAPHAPPNVAMLPYGDLSLLPDRPSQDKLQVLRKALEKWRTAGPGAPPRALVLEDLPTPYAAKVFLRGNPNNKGEPAPRQAPAAMTGGKQEPFERGSGRLELARAIVDRQNPLTARVIVNRIWMHHFGAGLVRTPSDFGLRSEPPSHPELLDHLATWFMDHGWSLKQLHRLIVLSATYQQESGVRAQESGVRSQESVDPENRLLWRMNRRRLDFEATRDTLLAVSGKLNCKVGGPSVRDAMSNAANRRTMYSHLDRLNVPGLFRTFDFPSPDATNPQRDTTTIAPQALFLMNHPFVMDCAKAVVRRPDVAGLKDELAKVDRLHRLLYARAAAADEQWLAGEYLQKEGNAPAAWERYVHALLLVNEMVTVD
jgi:hypothetical protein